LFAESTNNSSKLYKRTKSNQPIDRYIQTAMHRHQSGACKDDAIDLDGVAMTIGKERGQRCLKMSNA
jgi:hypothetical protein